MPVSAWFVLVAALSPFVYYLIAIYSSFLFFRCRKPLPQSGTFTPPVSNLRPIRGLDPDAYENCASLCRQDYPQFELLFCVSGPDDPSVPVLEQLARDFPERSIRIIYGSGRSGANDKVAKLARLAAEARYEHLVINDSDVSAGPDYFRTVIAPLENKTTGAVTCFYFSRTDRTFAQHLHSVGMLSDFFAGIIVAWKLDGVKFALGKTIVTTKANLDAFGGYAALENRPADDLLVGRLIAHQGLEVKLLPYSVWTAAEYSSFLDLLHRRLRWLVVMRHMRPGGHFGLLFTQGLIWTLVAIAVHPTPAVIFSYLGAYFALRVAMTWMIGRWGLGALGTKLFLIPVWDATAFLLWLTSFTRSTIRWRDGDYRIHNGQLVPVTPHTEQPPSTATPR